MNSGNLSTVSATMSYPNNQPLNDLPPPSLRTMATDLQIRNPTQSNLENGYDTIANETLDTMYNKCKFLSFAYQFILDRNFKFSTRLSILSMVSSSLMSIFAGFKLWIGDDKAFQSYSDITMLITNFLIAAATTASKNYIDDKRNDAIRTYVSMVDNFLGILQTQMSFATRYRMPANDFIEKYKDTYGKIISDAPNASIKEIILAKERYKFMNYVLENDEVEVRTCLCFTRRIEP